MMERRRPDQKDPNVREELSHQVKQDPRRERSGPLWVAVLQQLQADFETMKHRITALEAELAAERALRIHATQISGEHVKPSELADASLRPTVEMQAPSQSAAWSDSKK